MFTYFMFAVFASQREEASWYFTNPRPMQSPPHAHQLHFTLFVFKQKVYGRGANFEKGKKKRFLTASRNFQQNFTLMIIILKPYCDSLTDRKLTELWHRTSGPKKRAATEVGGQRLDKAVLG